MENYKFNPVSKTLIVTAAFEKAMNDPNSDEYRLYIQLQQDIPGLRHVVKICVSDFRQSQVWRCESGAVRRLDPLTTPFPRTRDGMHAAGGVNAVSGAGEP